MEVIMPLAVGVLTSLAAGLLLPAERRSPLVAARPSSNASVLLAWARSAGSVVPEGALVHPGLIRCADEALRIFGADKAGAPPVPDRARTGAGMLLLMSGAGLAAGIALAPSAWGAVAGAVLPLAVCFGAAARRRAENARRVEAAMPEAFGALAISLGSGHSLGQAMRFVGTHADEPVRTEFLRVSSSMVCGIPAAEALDEMLRRLPAPGLELVSLALKVSQRTGAPLKGLLEDAAATVGERMELSRRLDVKTSQARMSARLVALMPVAMIALLTLFSSDFRQGLGTVAGMVSVAVAAALNLCAWLIIRKIMEVKI